MKRVERGRCGQSRKRNEEEAKEKDFAGKPGAVPHFECAPGVGWSAEVKDGDVKSENGESEDESERDRTVMVREECCNEGSSGELNEGCHPDQRPVRMAPGEGFQCRRAPGWLVRLPEE